jgi:hypothetical protein
MQHRNRRACNVWHSPGLLAVRAHASAVEPCCCKVRCLCTSMVLTTSRHHNRDMSCALFPATLSADTQCMLTLPICVPGITCVC